MTKAEQRALEKYPPRKDGRMRGYSCTDEDVRKIYAQGYRKAEKYIIALIESRLSELLGDAQPTPALRAELQDLIKKIKEENG